MILGLLVYVIYYTRFFSKVLANRLKRILPKIIIEHQSAFTKSSLISDNILVAFESLHNIQKHKGKDDYMAIKLDMSRWSIEQWINLLMLCVKFVSYSILVNGEPKGMIHPSKGIRQEILCPLSSSCYPQKDYMALLAKSHPKGIFGVTPYVGMTID